jgi:hypothetical protein
MLSSSPAAAIVTLVTLAELLAAAAASQHNTRCGLLHPNVATVDAPHACTRQVAHACGGGRVGGWVVGCESESGAGELCAGASGGGRVLLVATNHPSACTPIASMGGTKGDGVADGCGLRECDTADTLATHPFHCIHPMHVPPIHISAVREQHFDQTNVAFAQGPVQCRDSRWAHMVNIRLPHTPHTHTHTSRQRQHPSSAPAAIVSTSPLVTCGLRHAKGQ